MNTTEPELIPEMPANAVAVRQPSQDPEGLLRYAVERGATVETIERLMNVRRELKAEQAKAAYDSAMADFQAACPVILKLKSGAKDAYKYAPLEDLLESRDANGNTVKQLIREHGFSHRATSEIETGWVKAIVTITHSAGHSEKSEFKVPIDSGNQMANDPQKYAGSMTFALRYAFKQGFGILTADEDLDGRVNRPKPQGPSTLAPTEHTVKELAKELWTVLKTVRGSERTWKAANQWLLDEAVISDTEFAPEFPPKRFREVIDKAKETLNKPKP